MADAKGNGGEEPTQWDSTSKIAGNLDRHLVFPLLDLATAAEPSQAPQLAVSPPSFAQLVL